MREKQERSEQVSEMTHLWVVRKSRRSGAAGRSRLTDRAARWLALLLLAFGLCAPHALARSTGFVVTFNGTPPPYDVTVKESRSIMHQFGYAAFSQLTSHLQVTFNLDDHLDVSHWTLRVVDRCQPQALYDGNKGLSARLLITVNGNVVSSDNVIWGQDSTQSFDVGRFLSKGSNVVRLTLGTDSVSVLYVKSIRVGRSR